MRLHARHYIIISRRYTENRRHKQTKPAVKTRLRRSPKYVRQARYECPQATVCLASVRRPKTVSQRRSHVEVYRAVHKCRRRAVRVHTATHRPAVPSGSATASCDAVCAARARVRRVRHNTMLPGGVRPTLLAGGRHFK